LATPSWAERSRTRASTAAKSANWLAWQASALILSSKKSEIYTTIFGDCHCIT
jgi:hypothetical protein